jgi:anthranilate synthase component 2
MKKKVTLLDNFDSFTFNLVEEFRRLGASVEVWRNDVSLTLLSQALKEPGWKHYFVLSPGPGTPGEAGCLVEAIRQLGGAQPTLGVCLGHQAMAEAFHGRVGRAGEIVHGKTSPIHHNGQGIFKNLEDPLTVARYHSLAILEMPDCLKSTAWVEGPSGPINMGLEHGHLPMVGVQFHPESIGTRLGATLLANFLSMGDDHA